VRVVDLLEVVYVEHDERERLMHARGKAQVAFKLHVEGAAVNAARERIRERLLLNLREQARVADGERQLIGHRAQQQALAFLPDAPRIVRADEQCAHVSLLTDERDGDGGFIRAVGAGGAGFRSHVIGRALLIEEVRVAGVQLSQ
jgi:hypothetical protein